MAELTWTAEAERWLHDIYDYIAQDNPAAAVRTVEALHHKAQVLREFPESGYRKLWEKKQNVPVFSPFRLDQDQPVLQRNTDDSTFQFLSRWTRVS